MLVDNGVMRLNECEKVKETLRKRLGIRLTIVDDAGLFFSCLEGVNEPEKKHKILRYHQQASGWVSPGPNMDGHVSNLMTIGTIEME